MTNAANPVFRLTDPALPTGQRGHVLHEFARTYGWRPSDELPHYPTLEARTNGHLVVEHGLDNTAVITFLKRDSPFSMLALEDRVSLLSISYNNLVDWHLFPDTEGVTAVFNRVRPLAPRRVSIYEDSEVWRAEAFDRITACRPSPNLASVERALIDTISIWKRTLASELGHAVKPENLSGLFNAVLFVRALEDHQRHLSPNTGTQLLETWSLGHKDVPSIRICIRRSLRSLGIPRFPSNLLDEDALTVFDALDRDTVTEFLHDFYENRFAPYRYDFSLMSKHALSRIYEKYVALLRQGESQQLTLFPELPEEANARALGGVYTPQYIARFFGRFLRENLTPRSFRRLRTIDPACGSGIFLRTILEMQCDPVRSGASDKGTVELAFANVLGIDVDPNACHATRLSLALLHLILVGSLPKPTSVQVIHDDAIAHFSAHEELSENFDAVIANPPFVKWDNMAPDVRARVAEFMAQYNKGKVDMFLAHLKLGLEMVKPGGFLLYVLPHSFLIGRNAASLRKEISSSYWVRCLVDLSEVPVFGEVGSYVILLILQRRAAHVSEPPRVTIVRCRERVGHALESALEAKSVRNDFYEVYDVRQERFTGHDWNILSPLEATVHEKIQSQPHLEEFLITREGFVTGADDIFIVDRESLPPGEEAVYVPYLSDREMDRYVVPARTDRFVFYPYLGSRKITEDQLQNNFKKTWHYLQQHRRQLKQRPSVKRGDFAWWCPERPREPQNMLRPKIVSPHLIVLPRFSLDANGEYAVSRSPLMYPRESGDEIELLQYFLAVLNSSISMWQIVHSSHKYSRGYAMLEPKTLKSIAVPDPSQIDAKTMKRLLSLVRRRLEDPTDSESETRLDHLVADLYRLSGSERRLVGMEDAYG